MKQQACSKATPLTGSEHIGAPAESHVLYGLQAHNTSQCAILFVSPEHNARVHLELQFISGHVGLGPTVFWDDPSSSNPNENRTAQVDVEKALMNWGRFSPALDAANADLVISVRRGYGKAVSNTIGGVPNDRSVIMEPIDSGIRIGAQHGTPPPVTAESPSPRPHPQTEIGPSEDTFTAYRGKVECPLDNAPVWRYVAKDALSSPSVPAVAQFQKVIEQTEKELAEKQQKKP